MKSFWNKAKPFVITGLIAIVAITLFSFLVNRFTALKSLAGLQASLAGGKLPGES